MIRTAVAAMVAALALCGGSLAGLATTAPAKSVLVEVLITDRGIVTAMWVASLTHNGLLVQSGPIPRGDYVSINVLNRGKSVHDFKVFGKRTPPIKPGGKAHLFFRVMQRGTFPYRSTLDKGKSFRGFFSVA
jgi:hypothetical protein